MASGADPIDELLGGACAGDALPGAVAIVVDADGVVYEGAAGRLSVYGDAPARVDTMFRIASMTKALASVAVLQLIESGRLGLEDPVESVLPELADLQVLDGFDGDTPRLRPATSQPTIRQMLNHTSGFGYFFTNEQLERWHRLMDVPTVLDGVRAAIETPLVNDPGECWEYGVSTDWLGEVVGAVSGQTLDVYLAEHVFEPLGMTDTTFFPTDAQRERMMDVHDRTADGGLAISAVDIPEQPEIAFAGSGACATAGDYGRFLRALLRGGELDGERILRTETVDMMLSDHLAGAPLPEVSRSAVPALSNDVPSLPFKQGWGLGLHLMLEDVPGMRRAGTGDWAGLFNSYFWLDREAGVAAAFFTQLLPFFDAKMLETLVGFELAVYAQQADLVPG